MFKIHSHCKYIDKSANSKKKIIIWCIFLVFFALEGYGQALSSTFLEYIDRYKHIAIRHSQEYGIPASITLAQGLLESGAGRSKLAKESNNHFGIKCYGWDGERSYQGAEIDYNCYRKYNTAEEGFEDHAKFLKRDRYKRLYDLPVSDYKGWAYGLKACGYAEDPGYAPKLIKLIETYQLYLYDSGQPKSAAKHQPQEKQRIEEEKEPKTAMKPAIMAHNIHKKWGKYYVVAKKGDTYEAIAEEFNKKTKDILSFNDIAERKATPKEGEQVWLEKKYDRHPEVAFYVAKKGDTLHEIAQKFCVQQKWLLKLNAMKPGEQVITGQKIFFR
ncbi:MAG: glucosaminidase domain-containing protein [Sodaliphilus sp.]